jgi:hypothetical protein
MAFPSAPCCQIRALVMHVYPDGIKLRNFYLMNVKLPCQKP